MMTGVPVASTGMLGTVRESKRCLWERAAACSAPEAQKTRTRPRAKAFDAALELVVMAVLPVGSHRGFLPPAVGNIACPFPLRCDGDHKTEQSQIKLGNLWRLAREPPYIATAKARIPAFIIFIMLDLTDHKPKEEYQAPKLFLV